LRALCALVAGSLLVGAASSAVPTPGGVIAFTIKGERTTKLYTARPDGSGRQVVSRFRCCGIVSEDAPAWSHDGRQLAFVRGTYRERGGVTEVFFEIHARPRDGGPARRVLAGKFDHSPTWSPNARAIAFSRDGPAGDGVASIMVVGANGSGLRALTSGQLDRMPAWSPRQPLIAFVRNPPSPFGARFRDSRLMLMDLSGSNVRPFPGRLRGWSPAWSPDGRRLAFVAGGDVYVVGSNGSGRRRLTRTAAREGRPTWSPDGRWLAFEGPRGLHTIQIVSRRVRLIEPNGTGPAWSPR
jgi:Tol biopolymer transport system component